MSAPLYVIKSVTMTDAKLTATSVAEADYAAYNGATTYASADRVIDTSSGVHKIYESLQGANTGNALTDALWWSEVSATNRWKLFDLSSTTQTVVDAADYYEITPAVAINALALLNISGILTVRVRMTDPSFGVVYDETADLADVPSEASWYAWFFDERTEQTKFLATDLPSYPNAVLRVDVTSSGTAYIGGMVFGTRRSIGINVSSGVRLGIQDFSRKERNDWGDIVLVQRAYASRVTFSMLILNTELDNTFSLLADIRATPALFIGSESYGSLTVFGFTTNFEIGISYPQHSECSVDIESLI